MHVVSDAGPFAEIDLRSVVLSADERRTLTRAAAILAKVRELIDDEEHPDDTDLALAMYNLRDWAEAGRVEV